MYLCTLSNWIIHGQKQLHLHCLIIHSFIGASKLSIRIYQFVFTRIYSRYKVLLNTHVNMYNIIYSNQRWTWYIRASGWIHVYRFYCKQTLETLTLLICVQGSQKISCTDYTVSCVWTFLPNEVRNFLGTKLRPKQNHIQTNPRWIGHAPWHNKGHAPRTRSQAGERANPWSVFPPLTLTQTCARRAARTSCTGNCWS